MRLAMPIDYEHILREWTLGSFSTHEWEPAPYVDTVLSERDLQVVLINAGGTGRTVVSAESRLIFDCYATTEAAANKLSGRCFAAVRDLDSRKFMGAQFYEIDPTIPQNYPDPRKPNLFRYQFNALIHAQYIGAN